MSTTVSSRTTTRRGASRWLILVIAIAAVTAGAVWAIALRSRGQPFGHGTAKSTAALRSLPPRERRYVTGLASLSPARLHGAFGTDRVSSTDAALVSLAPEQQQYVRALSSLSYAQLSAGFGTGR